ncbi:MAG: LicD family protein [Clostridia bacterium]|nr:LicD family protein [Clostridia bacterium]
MKFSSPELKSKLLEMFKWFHDFCVKNNLKYYMLAGTMLGAARHEGFIPWDDDIDVGMPREDYEKLEQILVGKQDKYILETPNSDSKDFFYPISKLYDTTTTLIENTKCKIKRGIYIDIFPLDGMGSTENESKQIYSKVKRKHNLLLTRTTGIRKGRSFLKNAAVVCARLIPGFILNKKKILKNLSYISKTYNYDNSSLCGTFFGAYGFKEIINKDVIGKPTIYKFEGLDVYGVENANEYLTSVYGDWRKLPPKEKRVSHHDFIDCDLSKPFI